MILVTVNKRTGDVRPLYSGRRSALWHELFYELVDAGWPQSDARDEIDRRYENARRATGGTA